MSFKMNSKKTSSYFSLIAVTALLSLLSGCASYKTTPLRKLPITVSQEESVSFEYHVLDRKDCKKYLDRNVMAQGYQPIHLTITNNSNKYLHLSLADCSLTCIEPHIVAKSVHTSTAARAAGYSVLGVLTCGLFFIPAVVDGVGSSEANKKLDNDFDCKTIGDQTIPPHRTINGLIFTPKEEFDSEFDFTLIDQANKERFTLSTLQRACKIEHRPV